MEASPKGFQKYSHVINISALLFLAYVLIRSCIEFFNITWGTGLWLGEFSLKWGLVFFVFALFCILYFIGLAIFLLNPKFRNFISRKLVSFRGRVGLFRWGLIVILIILPVWFLQFTPWGVVFNGFYFRLLLWIIVVFLTSILLSGGTQLLGLKEFLSTLLIFTSLFSIAYSMIDVIDYPFSLHWSEGNRLWDYSLLFSQDLYNYPLNQKIYSLTDVGRQLVGGLPFVLPRVSIFWERFWVGLTSVIPYLLLGLAAFRSEYKDKKLWFLLAFFTFIFLKQGPIHAPLVLCAFLVALLWRKPLWFAVPLIFVTSYLAEASRFTWLFAPGIWIVMLEFSGAILQDGHLKNSTWWRSATLGLSGVLGGYFGEPLFSLIKELVTPQKVATVPGESISVSFVSEAVSQHPLLWYRLFPNLTYGNGLGILLGLLIAVGPLVLILLFLTSTKTWNPNRWQKLALLLPLLAFFVVGAIVSTKIGGGGDLHNLDMFLIGLLFTGVIAWENGGRQWLGKIESAPVQVKILLVLLFVIPGIQPLSVLRSYQFAEDLPWLVTMTDVQYGKFLEMLPVQDEVDDILSIIRKDVDEKKDQGEILFMDQRQLLTFGYIEKVPFVPEYEKKVLMNEAMAEDYDYFYRYYSDLASKRFSLIISDPFRRTTKDSEVAFGEENNYWVDWVVKPTLCYYVPIETFTDVQIQLLVPREGDFDCSSKLPIDMGIKK